MSLTTLRLMASAARSNAVDESLRRKALDSFKLRDLPGYGAFQIRKAETVSGKTTLTGDWKGVGYGHVSFDTSSSKVTVKAYAMLKASEFTEGAFDFSTARTGVLTKPQMRDLIKGIEASQMNVAEANRLIALLKSWSR